MTAVSKLHGVTILKSPGCFKEDGEWKGIAYDILKLLGKVKNQSKLNRLKLMRVLT